jgi:hypothetical protein
MIYFYILIIAYLVFIIFQIRVFILRKYIKESILKSFELNEYFIDKSKKELENNNYESLMELHYNTSLLNIYRYNLENNKKIIFNLKKEKIKIDKDLYNIFYISKTKEYDIDYFIQDLEILKEKDEKSKSLRLVCLFHLLKLNYNISEIKKLFN